MKPATGCGTPPAFRLDVNACVGCHACAIACVNENALAPGQSWRQIVSFNPDRRPRLPAFHLSLACNHCLDAPCLRACPARAISRDPQTGAVLIDDASCIGCRYCSWVCPYDAPKFDAAHGVMRKCTLCAHRLGVGKQPACVSQCPTGALRLGPYEVEGFRDVEGFPQFPARPAISFVPLRRLREGPVELLDAGGAPPGANQHDAATVGPAEGRLDTARPLPKISARGEWALVAFTCVAMFLVAWQWASVFGGPGVHPWFAAILAGGAMAVSTSHLGRPGRAWRAALNWRHSWLSREIIAFPLFVGALLAVPLIGAVPADAAGRALREASRWLPWMAAAAGLALLLCVDRVYVAMATRGLRLDRVAALSAGVFLAGVLSGTAWLACAAGAVRLASATTRHHRRRASAPRHRHGRTVLRVAVGLGAPCVLWLAGFGGVMAAGAAVAGEILDRVEFYDALDVVTPAAEMEEALIALNAAAEPDAVG